MSCIHVWWMLDVIVDVNVSFDVSWLLVDRLI